MAIQRLLQLQAGSLQEVNVDIPAWKFVTISTGATPITEFSTVILDTDSAVQSKIQVNFAHSTTASNSTLDHIQAALVCKIYAIAEAGQVTFNIFSPDTMFYGDFTLQYQIWA
jgi:hypothetical protein